MDKVLLITGTFTLALLLRRFGLIRESYVGMLVRYVMTVSLPCLTLMIIGSLDLRHAHFEIAGIAWLVMAAGILLSYTVGRLSGLSGKRLRAFMLVSTFPNTAFLGYPYTFSLFGGKGLSYAVIYDQLGMFPLFLSLGFFIAGGRDSLWKVIRFPPFIALIAALILNRSGLIISGPTAKVLNAVGWTTLPLTIFILGLKVRFIAMRNIKGVVTSLSLRMLIIPLILYLVLRFLGMEDIPYQVAIMESAMPPALITGILAVSCISVGTVLSLILFSAVMLLRL
jgi:malate permease and related proteins